MTKTSYPFYQIFIIICVSLIYIFVTKDIFFAGGIIVIFLLQQKDAYLMYDEKYLYKKKTVCPFWSKDKYNKYSLSEIKSFEDDVRNITIYFETETVVINKINIISSDNDSLINLLQEHVNYSSRN